MRSDVRSKRCLEPRCADGAAIIGLTGSLGAGKTTFARAVLRALGVAGTVRSPTYTIAEPYETRIGRIWHLDLYRIEDPDELEYIAIRDLVSDCDGMFRRMAGARPRWAPGARLPADHHPGRTWAGGCESTARTDLGDALGSLAFASMNRQLPRDERSMILTVSIKTLAITPRK